MRRWPLFAVFLLLSSSALAQQTKDITVGPSPSYKGRALYGNSWAVLIGINRYQDPKIPTLSFALNDVRAMKETLLRQGFPEGQVLTLIDSEATKKSIEVLLGDRLRRRVGREDRILIFFSGHGKDEEIRPNEYEGYLIPYDADPDSLFGTSISMSALKQIGERIGAKHVLFAVDACYSGFAIFRGKSIINRELVEDLTRHPAVQVITAGRRGELAQEKDGQGLFTRAFIRALEGAADRRGWGWVSLEHVGEYVRDRVYADSGRGQYPQFGNLAGEGQFVFVLPSEGRLPSPPVPPAPGPPAPPRDPTAELLARADGFMARQALTTPPGANAYEVLQETLRVNPNHPGGLERLRKIGENYKGWARRALERGQGEVARRYVDSAKKVFPEDPEIAELEARLEAEGRKAAEAAKAEAEA